MQEIKQSVSEILAQQESGYSWKFADLSFEWKHMDEVVLHYCRPCAVQTKYELLKLIIPMMIVDIILVSLFFSGALSLLLMVSGIWIIAFFFTYSIFYKTYRAKNNYLFITSKRVLFHGIEWFFKDYVKKISIENIRNINFFTESMIGRMFDYGTLHIQSSHGGKWDIKVYHIKDGKMLTHYIDKLMSLSPENRSKFSEFDPDYFKNWKQ